MLPEGPIAAAPLERSTLPEYPEALTPEATLMLPLEPADLPVVSVAAPLTPEPPTEEDMMLTLPEPVETPTPEDRAILPPSPEDEVLAPAEMAMEPPLPASEEPT
jgi:hypothetical protein